MGGEKMKTLYILIYIMFVYVLNLSGQNLAVKALASHDTLYTTVTNVTVDTVYLRVNSRLVEGSFFYLYRRDAKGEEWMLETSKELYDSTGRWLICLAPSESRSFISLFEEGYLQNVSSVKYKFFCLKPVARMVIVLPKKVILFHKE